MSHEQNERIQKFIKSGEIAKTVKLELPNIVKVGTSVLEIAEKIEELIANNGGVFAFPANISINSVAAHFTPTDEDIKINEDDMVKVDFGVHIDGYPVDNALTFYFGENDEYKSMVETAKDAVMRAISEFKVGVELSHIGEVIEELVKERGFKVIRNLTGHMLDQYELHGEKEVPTFAGSKAIGKIEEGEVYAIEVFVTNGEGYAKSIDEVHIYSLLPELPKRLPIRVKAARDILNFIRKERKGLPFSVRWLRKHFDNATVKVGLSLLEQYGVLIPYPVLVEKGNGIVAQHEETVLVKKDETIVLTQVK